MSGEIFNDCAIPPGEYQLRYVDYRTLYAWGVPRVVIRFSVLDYGEFFEHETEAWYRVKELTEKPKKFGNFKVGTRSALYRQFTCLLGDKRPDRISPAALKDKVVVASIRTVEIDQKQKKLHESLQYSTVDELLMFG